MQNIDIQSNNPLKTAKDSETNKQTQSSHLSTKKIPKINPKYFLILIPIGFGILSLLLSSLVKKDSVNITKQQKAIPTTVSNQNSDTLPDTNTPNSWQKQLKLLDQETNLNQEITPPKIEKEITF